MHFTIWKDTAGQWRWTLRARNGKIVADSSEGYGRRASAVRMCTKINSTFPVREA
jgi:uncharacterized protein YegP (UPF0339 family)